MCHLSESSWYVSDSSTLDEDSYFAIVYTRVGVHVSLCLCYVSMCCVWGKRVLHMYGMDVHVHVVYM